MCHFFKRKIRVRVYQQQNVDFFFLFLQCTQALIVMQSLNRCHFLQTSVFCCGVRGQAQAVAACLLPPLSAAYLALNINLRFPSQVRNNRSMRVACLITSFTPNFHWSGPGVRGAAFWALCGEVGSSGRFWG